MATAAEPLRAILDTLSDRVRGEILEGRLIVTPRPTNQHQLIVARLLSQLAGDRRFVVLTEPELRLGDDVLVPDLAGWKAGALPPGYATEPPPFVVEVLSPSTRRYDREQKVALYAAHGVAHVWILDPDERSIEVFSGGRLACRVLEDAVLPPFDGEDTRVFVSGVFA
jgi:Uma2 family endonuclease